jgi:hypothetical protein
MAPQLLILALEYYRAPLSYRHLTNPDRPLPEGFDDQVDAFATALLPRNIETTAQDLGTSPDVIKSAALFFLRQVLLTPGSDHYRVLGLSRDASRETIRRHYHLLVRIFHPDQSEGDPERDVGYTARLNDAYDTLRRPDARLRYDRQLTSNPSRRRVAVAKGGRSWTGRSLSPVPFVAALDTHIQGRNRRLILLLGGAVAISLVVISIMWTSSKRPVLRVNPELANSAIAEPSFLRHMTSPEPVAKIPQRTSLSLERPTDSTADANRDATQEQRAPLSAASVPAIAPINSESPEPASDETSKDATRVLTKNELPQEQAPRLATGAHGPSPLAREVATAATDDANRSATQKSPASHLVTDPADILPMSNRSPAPLTDGSDKKEIRSAAAMKRTPPVKARMTTAPEKILSKSSKSRGMSEPAAPSIHPSRPEGMLAKRSKIEARDMASVARRTNEQRDRPVVTGNNGKELVVHKPPTRETTRRQPDPEKVIARLTRSYQAGDLQGFLNLFTPTAQTSGGSGKSFIRADYAGFFARTSDRRLSIFHMQWQQVGNDNIIGNGTYRAGTKVAPDTSWHYSTGTMHIELVPSGDSYKISRLMH